jgi:hypothetical protein
MPFFIGGLFLIFLYIFFYGIWSKHWNPADLFTGQDKRSSSSKFQFWASHSAGEVSRHTGHRGRRI